MVTHSHCQVTSAPTTRSILNIGGIFVYLLWKCVMVNIKKLVTFYLALVQAPVEPHGTVGQAPLSTLPPSTLTATEVLQYLTCYDLCSLYLF